MPEAIRWPGVLWRKIETEGAFWMRDEDVWFSAGQIVPLWLPAGQPVGRVLILSIDEPVEDKPPRFKRPRILRRISFARIE